MSVINKTCPKTRNIISCRLEKQMTFPGGFNQASFVMA